MGEQRLWGLGVISVTLDWLESLLNILNGPLLLVGAGIALVDLLTDGALTISVPLLLYAWAISQALGIDTQLLGCFARARGASGAASIWQRVGWLALGLVLGYAAWQAGYVFAVQQSQHISEADALAQLGMSPALWLGWRAFLAVGLVALSGWTRYRAPAKVATTLADEQARLERELTLEPLRQRLRAQRVGGWRAVAETAIAGERQTSDEAREGAPDEQSDEQADEPPDGPGGGLPDATRDGTRRERTDVGNSRRAGNLRTFTRAGHNPRRLSASAEAARRRRAYTYLDAQPDMPKAALRRKLRCAKDAADGYWHEWQAAHAQSAQAAG